MSDLRDMVSLATLMEGGIVEQFDEALRLAAENCLDPNTEATATRTVSLTVKLKPNVNREVVDLDCQVVAKPAPDKPVSTTLFLGKTKQNQAVLAEKNARQNDLFNRSPQEIAAGLQEEMRRKGHNVVVLPVVDIVTEENAGHG